MCGNGLTDSTWIPEYAQFFMTCPWCITFTIPPGLARTFATKLCGSPELARLSLHLRDPDNEDDREVTEDSWREMCEAE